MGEDKGEAVALRVGPGEYTHQGCRNRGGYRLLGE